MWIPEETLNIAKITLKQVCIHDSELLSDPPSETPVLWIQSVLWTQ